MPDVITITANWATGSLSSRVISRQYDNNRYRIQFMGYPEDGAEDLLYYLLVWMRTEETPNGAMLPPIQMDSDQWLISNYFTQKEQQIRFQLCIQNAGGTYEAHSPIFNGAILDSLEHDGEDIDIDTSALFDYYREYVNDLIIAAGAVVIDTDLDTAGAAADAKATGDAITELNGRLEQIEGGGGGLTADVKAALLACFNHVAWDDDDPTGQSYISALQTALYPPANLSSISAVYTQPGTVYDTATLNSLKANLVVTAHYSDSTTETVTNYTLSGTLIEGTSTITVSYGGKTTTFTVIVTEYEPVTETISWSGSGTDKTSSLIDATQMTAYLTIPFESEASQLVEGATAESQGMKIRTWVYSDSAAQNLVGYYYIDMNEIETTARTTANSPWCLFDTEMVAVPQGYYGTIKISRQGTNVFADNSSCGTYLNAYATSVEMR